MMQEIIPYSIQQIIWELCGAEDGNREGLKETPARVLRFYEEFLHPPELKFTTFDAEGMNEMVCVHNIPFYSICEHHLVPFFGEGHIAYIPNKKIVGLSKLPRVLDMFARRFQNQERITAQTATYIEEHLSAFGVAVVLKARHMCMEMRGVRKPGTYTTTSTMLGVFKTDFNARQEFLQLIK
jgi:GTP cyclohydrolase I